MKLIKPLSLAMTLLMTACASLSPSPNTNATNLTKSDSNAKAELERAIKAQLRSSFSYQTHVYASNQLHQNALAKSVAPAKNCADKHDDAYVALVKTAKQNGKTIDDDSYNAERAQIRDDYLACKSQEPPLYSYEPFDLVEFYQQNQQLGEDEQAQAFIASSSAHMASQISINDIGDIEDGDKDPILSAKKAKLLEAYLLKPTQLSLSGSYRPLAGVITALPMLGYQSKNLTATLAQPIYLDLKAQGIYLWADNFAFANSQFLDKKLGDKWHNKWLFIPINDGSLPKDFAKDLFDALISAQKERFATFKADDFQIITPAQFDVPFIQSNLPTQAIKDVMSTTHIIKKQSQPKDRAYGNYVFYDTLYNTITAKYPSLARSEPAFDRTISEGQSLIEIASIDDTTRTDQKPTINSELLMKAFFAYLKGKIDNYTTSDLQYEPDASYTPITHYGIEHGKLSWLHHRYYLNDFGTAFHQTLTSDEPIFIDSFTYIHQNSHQVGEFNRLPSTARTPTSQNSIHLFDYKNDLLERLKNSDEHYIKMLVELLLGADEPSESDIEPNH